MPLSPGPCLPWSTSPVPDRGSLVPCRDLSPLSCAGISDPCLGSPELPAASWPGPRPLPLRAAPPPRLPPCLLSGGWRRRPVSKGLCEALGPGTGETLELSALLLLHARPHPDPLLPSGHPPDSLGPLALEGGWPGLAGDTGLGAVRGEEEMPGWLGSASPCCVTLVESHALTGPDCLPVQESCHAVLSFTAFFAGLGA